MTYAEKPDYARCVSIVATSALKVTHPLVCKILTGKLSLKGTDTLRRSSASEGLFETAISEACKRLVGVPNVVWANLGASGSINSIPPVVVLLLLARTHQLLSVFGQDGHILHHPPLLLGVLMYLLRCSQTPAVQKCRRSSCQV